MAAAIRPVVRRVAWRLAWLALVLTAAAGPASAQENPLAPDHPGAWRAPDVRVADLPAGARAAALAVAGQLYDIVRRLPDMAPKTGFDVIPHTFVTFDNVDRTDNPRLPKFVRIEVTANLVPWERSARGVEANERDTAGSVTVVVNGLEHTGTAPKGDGWSDERGTFIESPEEPVETKHGFPVYQEGNLDRWVFMRRHDVPLLAPVTRARYLQAEIRLKREELAKVEARRARIPAGVPASVVATVDEALGQLRSQVADLQREAASPHSSGDGPAVFTFNPALLDPALPPSTPQTLSVRVRGNDELFPGLGDRLDAQLDWAALSVLLR